jgi:predicted acyltransferase (DUF342 family)
MTLLFVLATLVMVALPLIPALAEWYRPTDALPLKVVRDYDGSADHFAMRFRQFIKARMIEIMSGANAEPDLIHHGTLANGDATILIGRDQVLPESAISKAQEIDAVIAALGSVTLPANIFAKSEVYAEGNIDVSERTACRALLADNDLTLGAGCAVLRWAHAGRDLTTGPRARLWGRLTAGERIVLGRDSVFTRLHAPRIETGAAPLNEKRDEDIERALLAMPDNLHFYSSNRWVFKKELNVPRDTAHHGDLIAKGAVTVGERCRIEGSLKSVKQMTIGQGSIIEGAVIASKDLHIESNCIIVGPVVSESTVTIEAGCVIGSPTLPTTITAPRIRFAEGVVMHGSVWAREDGKILGDAMTRYPAATTREAATLAPAL